MQNGVLTPAREIGIEKDLLLFLTFHPGQAFNRILGRILAWDPKTRRNAEGLIQHGGLWYALIQSTGFSRDLNGLPRAPQFTVLRP